MIRKITTLILLFYCIYLSASPINEAALKQQLAERLGLSNIMLKHALHGGDNKVFFIKTESTIAIAKCYTKRSLDTVHEICCMSDKLGQVLPVPRTLEVFMLDDLVPVVIQEFLDGTHTDDLKSEQLAEVARAMANIHSVAPTSNQPVSTCEFYYQDLINKCADFPDMSFILTTYACIDQSYLQNLPISLIHGDFSASNILFIDNKISGIIDLDHARFSYRLTDVSRAQVFFSFGDDDNILESKVEAFIKNYQKTAVLSEDELAHFYEHMRLLLIRMILETYYYVEVRKEVSPEIFKKPSFNQSWQSLLKKLYSIESKTAFIVNDSHTSYH